MLKIIKLLILCLTRTTQHINLYITLKFLRFPEYFLLPFRKIYRNYFMSGFGYCVYLLFIIEICSDITTERLVSELGLIIYKEIIPPSHGDHMTGVSEDIRNNRRRATLGNRWYNVRGHISCLMWWILIMSIWPWHSPARSSPLRWENGNQVPL